MIMCYWLLIDDIVQSLYELIFYLVVDVNYLASWHKMEPWLFCWTFANPLKS